MKLRQKIMISALLLFMAVFTGANILTIENSCKLSFNRILQQARDEQESISSGIEQYVWAEREKNGDNGSKDAVTDYLDSRVNSQGTALEILADDKVLYSTLDFKQPVAVEVEYTSRLATYSRQEIDGKQYLILSSFFPLKDKTIRNLFFVDISGIYADRAQQYAFFLRLAAVTMLLLAAGLFLLTGRLTKTLRLLTASVRKIGEGNYRERIQIKAKDEAGELADSYNKMADAIESTVEELKRKNQEQQRFTDNFTHELRTPLTAVVGYADLLRSTSGDEEYVQELGECIFREGKRIEKLSEVMMDMIFLRRHTFDMEPCDAGDIIRQAVMAYEPAAGKAGLRLETVLPGEPVLLLAKPDLLLTLFGNLVDNAGKASEPGGRIWIRLREEGGSVTAEVEDEGKGIPEEEQARVFESFYQVDKVRNRKNNGVGLGLSLCSDIARIHGAKIELVSRVGKGTMVKIMFPCYKEVTKTG